MTASPYGILFVCTGNICRSPAAEGVLIHHARERGLLPALHIDSAGTTGYHVGESADPRTIRSARARGYHLPSRARRVTPADLQRFQLVVAMGLEHLDELETLARRHPSSAELRLYCEFLNYPARRDVPDPYYGGPEGFEHVMDLIEEATPNILDHVERCRAAAHTQD